MSVFQQDPDIPAAISALYEEAGVPPSSAYRSIVPLADLMGSYNLTCTEIRDLKGHRALDYLSRRGGMVDFPDMADDEQLAGFIYVTSAFGAVFVEQGDLLVRRRFSVAHELGHYLLHFRPLLTAKGPNGEPYLLEAMEAFPLGDLEAELEDLPVGHIRLTDAHTADGRVTTSVQMEREANLFASHLLMPTAVIQDLAARYAPTIRGEDLVWRLATEMLVSRSAMRWRLRGLDLLTSPLARWD